MRNVPGLETVYRDYSAKGVKFFYIYKALAHPETNGYVTPFSQDERLLHVREAQQRIGSGITWLCDTMENTAKHELGDAPNSEFVLGPTGSVIVRRAWSDPSKLRTDLAKLVGPSEQITTIRELDMKFKPPERGAKSGVVPRLKMTEPFEAIRVTPQPSSSPYYAKLRAEANRQLLEKGEGRLYLGFLLDPLYHVHWNNQAPPLKFSVSSQDGVLADPVSATAATIEGTDDVDPREFLIGIKFPPDGPRTIRVRVEYYACHDVDPWCRRIVQEYEVEAKLDDDGGWVQSRRRQQNGGKDAARKSSDSSDTNRNTNANSPERRTAAPNGRPRPTGTLLSVDVPARRISVRLRTGMVRDAIVAAEAKCFLNGQSMELADLRAGDRLTMELERGDNGPEIIRIEIERP